MGKGKRAGGKSRSDSAPAEAAQPAVLNLTMDSTSEGPREVVAADGAAFKTPCTLVGLGSGLSGGTLGWVFGFGGYWIQSLRGGGQWKGAVAAGWSSAKTFAVMGGLYAAVSCFMQRLRQKHDAWNGAASGCATGLALGWAQGPRSALQSCVMLGLFSYFMDGVGGGEAQAAAVPAGGPGSSGSSGSRRRRSREQEEQLQRWQQRRSALDLLLSPAMPLLAAVAPCAFAAEQSAGGGCGVPRGRQ